MLLNAFFTVLVGFVTVSSLVSEISRRQLAANQRHVVARNCAPQIAEFNAKRKAKRAALMKRDIHDSIQSLPPIPTGATGGFWHWHPAPGHKGPNGHGHSASRHGHSHSTHAGTKTRSTCPTATSRPTGVAAAVTGIDTTVIATAVSSSTDIVGTTTSSAYIPTYTTLQNSTCVTAPEVTEGPYYVANELLRNDLRETQAGVDLLLDIGVIDVTTCQPLENTLVEIWNCNATGQYSGFTTAQTSGGGSGGAPNGNSTVETMSFSMASGSVPTGTASMSVMSGSAPVMNVTGSGSMGTASTGASSGSGSSSTSMTDQETFLRGGAATGAGGVVEFTTIYPGFYTGRTVHIHAMIQTNYTVASNGSIISHAGQIHHVGQIFFDEAMNTQILAQPAYSNSTQTRTVNADDSIMAEENTDGFNAIADASLIGDDVSDGVLAYITIGVDLSFIGSIVTTNYHTAASDELATASATTSLST